MPFLKRAFCKAHHAETDRTVAHIRALGRLRWIEINIYDVIKGANGHGDRLPKRLKIKRPVVKQMGVEDQRAEIANRGLLLAAVESNFRAKIRGVDDARMVLRRAQVARILESQPGMTGFKERL